VYLAIDTSTETASLAIVQECQVLAELTWYCQQLTFWKPKFLSAPIKVWGQGI